MRKLFILTVLLISSVLSSLSAQIPSVTLKDINGNVVNTSEISNGGKPFIISFFATWCHPCRRELNNINEVYEDWQSETGVKVIVVSIDAAQDVAKVKPLVVSSGWDFEVLLDTNGDFKRELNITSVPTVIVFDGNGKIVSRKTGYVEGSENHLLEEVKEIIKRN